MNNNQTTTDNTVFDKIRNWINKFIEYTNSVVIGFGRFLKSSYFSITFVIIILLLVQSLDQANTLLVDMVEKDKTSLVLCFAIISFFAAVLSHYPLYLYYSKDINNSKDNFTWYAYRLFLGYHIFTYAIIDKNKYEQDYKAKFFRQALGLVIFSIWHYYIYQAFYPNLATTTDLVCLTKCLTIGLALIPLISLIAMLDKQNGFQEEKKTNKKNKGVLSEINERRKKYNKRGSRFLLILLAFVIFGAIITVFTLKFNYFGYWQLQIMTFLVSMLYVLFRIFRVYVRVDFKKFRCISDNVSFLRFYLFIFVILVGHLVYSNVAVYFNFWLSNAMFILLSIFFIIYYILACSLKYYFVIDLLKGQKEFLFNSKPQPMISEKGYMNKANLFKSDNSKHLLKLDDQEAFSEKRRRISSVLTVLFVILCAVSYTAEKRIHELEVYKSTEEIPSVTIDEFKLKLLDSVRSNKPMLFVAAHGGGLKANIWTMKVLNDIQKKSDGQFFNQTVSLSGASGGMMGLSLYSVLSGKYPNNYDVIAKKIDTVAYENFASRDIAFTFGYDFIRKFVPFHKLGKYRDRSYYAMVRYSNMLEGEDSKTLSETSFNTYWKENIYDANGGYFPSLIVNTAKTNGKRGVFYSVDYRADGKIFSNSDQLSQLSKGHIAFYEAVSSTNRFPALSPAAKVKGYGHYIDAGAIDNSGLLSSLDLYSYFEEDDRFKTRNKVFVEILNGKSSYVGYLIKKFKAKAGKRYKGLNEHIPMEEIEQDNIVADIKTGLNLDKIPNYLSDMLYTWDENGIIAYVPVYLPFHVGLTDVEDYIGGEITNSRIRNELEKFLLKYNKQLKEDLNDNDPSEWNTYEPTLARHLSKSTVEYYNRVLKGEIMTKQIQEVMDLLK